MTLDEQIAVMQAFRDGAEIEYHTGLRWESDPRPEWNWQQYTYRIAPKSGTYHLTLVERLRHGLKAHCLLDMDDVKQAADQIELLEEALNHAIESATTDELLAEIARRVGK